MGQIGKAEWKRVALLPWKPWCRAWWRDSLRTHGGGFFVLVVVVAVVILACSPCSAFTVKQCQYDGKNEMPFMMLDANPFFFYPFFFSKSRKQCRVCVWGWGDYNKMEVEYKYLTMWVLWCCVWAVRLQEVPRPEVRTRNATPSRLTHAENNFLSIAAALLK